MSYNEWLDIDVLEAYLDGKLDAKAMHRVEKLSLEDPFVAEALAGLSQSPKRTQSLSLLQKQLKDRIAQKPIEKKMWVITSHRLSIGAAAAVLFIAVSVLFWMKANKRQEMLAKNLPKTVDVTVAPQVAINKTATKIAPPVKIEAEQTKITEKASNEVEVSRTKAIVDKAPIVVANRQAEEISAIKMAPAVVKQEVANDEKLKEIALVPAKKETEKRVAVMALPSKADGIVANYFSGKVIAKENGLPIPGAIVRVSGVDRGTTTDKNGDFKIATDTTHNQKLTVGYIGYNTTEVGAKSNQPVNILLENSNSSLQEVVIATNTVTSMPLVGWDNYQKYIKANNKLVKSATASIAELSFDIKRDGSVTAIKIIKSAGKEMDKEAIRLVKNGPNWLYNAAKKNVGYLKIQF